MQHKLIHQVIGVAAAIGAPSIAAAQQTRSNVDAVLSGGYASSPFLTNGGGGASGRDSGGSPYVEGVIAPSLSQVDERGSVGFNGVGRITQYFNEYGTSWSITGAVDLTRSLDARTSIRANASVVSFVAGERGTIGLAGTTPIGVPETPVVGGDVVPTPALVDPLLPTDPLLPDLTLFGANRRQTSLAASAGATHQLSERDSVTLDAQVQRSFFAGGAFLGYETYGGTVGYQRALSTLTSIGGRVSYQRSQYGFDGDGDIYQPQVTLNTSVGLRWTIAAGAGLLVARTRTIIGRDDITGVSANLQACRTGERSTFCLSGLSDATPTGIGGVSRRVSVAATYQRRFGESDALSLTADYQRIGEQRRLTGRGDFAYLSSAATFDHRFSRRLTAGLALRYRDTIGDDFGQPTDKAVSAFVRTNLGRNR